MRWKLRYANANQGDWTELSNKKKNKINSWAMSIQNLLLLYTEEIAKFDWSISGAQEQWNAHVIQK